MNMFKTFTAVAAIAALLPATAIAQDGGAPLSSSLNGANEVPGPGDSDGAGMGTVRVNLGQGRVCYTLSVRNIAPATMAHIHKAVAGATGPVVVSLQAPSGGSSQGCVMISTELAKALIQNPEEYYFNVHNTEFPAGAVRGQLGR